MTVRMAPVEGRLCFLDRDLPRGLLLSRFGGAVGCAAPTGLIPPSRPGRSGLAVWVGRAPLDWRIAVVLAGVVRTLREISCNRMRLNQSSPFAAFE